MTSRRARDFLCSFDVLAAIYLVISILVARIYQNTIVLILAASASILLIPMLVGKSFISLIYKKRRNMLKGSVIASAAVEWFTGNLVIYCSASILSFGGVLEPRLYSFSLILLPAGYLIMNELRNGKTKDTTTVNDSLNVVIDRTFGNKIVIPFVLIAGLLPLLFLIPLQPFPLSPTQSWVRIRLSMSFIEEGYVELVRGYSHWISVILSIPAIIYDFHPLQVLSATNYLSHIIYPFALYLISYKITKDERISLVPAFVGPWIFLLGNLKLTTLENTPLVFHIFTWMLYIALEYYHPASLHLKDLSIRSSVLSLAIIFLSPITYILGKGGRVIPPNSFVFLSLILPMILISIYCALNRNCPRRIGVLLILVFPLTLAAIAHPFLGSMVVFFLGCFFFALSTSDKHLRKLRIISFILPIILIFVFLVTSTADNFALTRWIFGDLFKGSPVDISVQQKWFRFLDEGPALAVYLFLLSFYAVCISGSRKYVSLVFMSSVILFVTFLPEGFLWRAVAYLNPLAAVMLSYLMLFPLNILEKIKKKDGISNFMAQFKSPLDKLKKYHINPKSFYVLLILLLILPSVQFTRTEYFENFARSAGEGYTSWARTYDIDTSFWILDESRNERVLIISDPATMFFLGCITGKDTLMIEYVEFYPWEYSNETWILMEQLKQEVFLLLGKDGSYERIQEFSPDAYKQSEDYSKVFLVITPRTYYWLYENQTFPIIVKSIAVDSLDVVSNLDKDYDFNLVYKIDEVLCLYELKLRE